MCLWWSTPLKRGDQKTERPEDRRKKKEEDSCVLAAEARSELAVKEEEVEKRADSTRWWD